MVSSSEDTSSQKQVTFDILTAFPGMFSGVFDESIIQRAQKEKLVKIQVHDLRKWAKDKHKTIDDEPYGGGNGMVLKPEPIFKAVQELKEKFAEKHGPKIVQHVVLLTPKGTPYNFRIAEKLSHLDHVILICGHYEGVDHRVFDFLADEHLSIGEYILTGGEIPAMIVVDSVTRLVPGVLGNKGSLEEETFSFTRQGFLKYPVYTRPEEYEGYKVPEVLLSGDHAAVDTWRKEQAERLTKKMRPDLIK